MIGVFFFMIVIRINVYYRVVIVCVDGDWLCRYEQAAIEGEYAAPWAKACGCRWNVGRSRAGTVYCGTKKNKKEEIAI